MTSQLLAGNDLYEKSNQSFKGYRKRWQVEFRRRFVSKEFAARSETTAANWEIFKKQLERVGIVIGRHYYQRLIL